MDSLLSAPATAAQRQRDRLLGALIGLARATVNEPKTEDTDHVLAAGLRQAARADTAEDALRRMQDIVETEKLLAALFTLAQRRSTDRIRKEICDDLFVLAEDWDSSLLSPIVRRAEELCKE